jgi:hypothetical protein
MTRWREICAQQLVPWLMVTLAGGAGWASSGLELPYWRLSESRAVLLFWLLLLVALVWRGWHALATGKTRSGVAALGWLISILVAGLWSGLWFEGRLRLGEGEQSSRWEAVHSGPLTHPGPVSVQYLGMNDQKLQLLVNGSEHETLPGSSILVGRGLSLRVTTVSFAPLFVLSDGSGRLLHQGMVKIDPGGAEEFIRVGVLPHRFYLGVDAATASQEPAGNGRAPEVTPATLHLRVMRGKLTVLDSDLSKGEPVAFEGFRFRFEEGTTWINVEVRRSPLPPLAAIIIGLLIVVATLCRRTREP